MLWFEYDDPSDEGVTDRDTEMGVYSGEYAARHVLLSR